MTTLVADASVVVKCLVPEAGSKRAQSLTRAAGTVLAPDLLLSECANAVWKRVHRRLVTSEHATALLDRIAAFPVRLQSTRLLLPDAFALALEYDHPVYDCYYLAAAIQNDCALATADERLYDLAQRVGFGERAVLVR